jgi:anthranilate synthase component 2
MILVIDNYDSFTYNLVQYFGELGADLEIVRNDELTVEEIAAKRFEKIVISPGPCTPAEAGVSVDVIKMLAADVPILGVCLGHQSIGAALGGNVIRASVLMHGKTSRITHTGEGVFSGIPSPIEVTRYHSLIIERETLPECLTITAETDDGVIMAVKHRSWPLQGVQFHPEAVLTEHGMQMIQNFLEGR